MTSAAIYARVSSARQKKDQTIGSQTAALREHAAQNRLEVPAEWVFEDEGHSGATLVRPALEALRDLAAQGCLDVVLCYSPDRLARKFAYQALLIEEFARAGVRVEFVKRPARRQPRGPAAGPVPGHVRRVREGAAGRAVPARQDLPRPVRVGQRAGRRPVRLPVRPQDRPESGARYEIIEDEAALVAEMFRRYADDGASIADLARWLTGQGVPTRTGKSRWDRGVIWGMLRNPAYAGHGGVRQDPGHPRASRD